MRSLRSSMLSKFTVILRWAGAATMLLLILMLMVEGTWAVPLHRTWPAVLLMLMAAGLLAVAGVSDLRRKRWMAAMSHIGLFLVLMGGMLGAVVKTDVKMVVDSHASERVAYTDRGEPYVLPFSLRLRSFRIDYYPDGHSPKQYTSRLETSSTPGTHETSRTSSTPTRDTLSLFWKKVSHSDGKGAFIEASVNHPAVFHGWWLYQSDYDHAQQDFVIIQLVRDPWLPMVYAGFVLMLLGALMQTRRAWHSWKVWPAVAVLALVFAAASLARIELGTLVPALRSFWFFPHILVYMIAYSLLAITLLFALLNFIFPEKIGNQFSIYQKALTTVSALLLIGMLCGAVWAKDAWGDYWTWDAKECWAAVTWLITVLGSHVKSSKGTSSSTLGTPKTSSNPDHSSPLAPSGERGRGKGALFVLLATFLAMQITWYGVNYLPSAQYSMHTYNTETNQ